MVWHAVFVLQNDKKTQWKFMVIKKKSWKVLAKLWSTYWNLPQNRLASWNRWRKLWSNFYTPEWTEIFTAPSLSINALLHVRLLILITEMMYCYYHPLLWLIQCCFYLLWLVFMVYFGTKALPIHFTICVIQTSWKAVELTTDLCHMSI